MKKNVLSYIDFNRINKLLEGFNKSTGFVTAILDLDGNVLSKSGWRKICIEYHRVNSKTYKNCLISDTQLANMSIDNKYNIYKCHNGLYDVSVPLKIDNEHVANIFTGQFFMETPNEQFFQDQAERYGFELKAYIEALRNVPIVGEEKVKDIVEFLLSITNIIIDLTKDMIEQETLKTLLESSLESFNDILIWAVDKEYRYLYFNNAFKTGMKQLYDKNIIIGDELLGLINHPKDMERAKNNHDLALHGESHIKIEEYGIDDKRYFESSFSPIYDEYKNIIDRQGILSQPTSKEFTM